MAHSCVIGFGVFMAGFSTGLFYIGISMGYLYLLMGVIVSSAVIPATLTLLWKRQNAIAATATPVLGLICSLTAWLVTAKKEGGGLSVPSTGANNPMLAGNVVALLSPLIFVPALTYGFGADNYDYESMKSICRGEDSGMAAEALLDLELVPGAITWSEAEREEQSKLLRDSKIYGASASPCPSRFSSTATTATPSASEPSTYFERGDASISPLNWRSASAPPARCAEARKQ